MATGAVDAVKLRRGQEDSSADVDLSGAGSHGFCGGFVRGRGMLPAGAGREQSLQVIEDKVIDGDEEQGDSE